MGTWAVGPFIVRRQGPDVRASGRMSGGSRWCRMSGAWGRMSGLASGQHLRQEAPASVQGARPHCPCVPRNLVSDKQDSLAQCADFRSSLPPQDAMLCSGPLAIVQGRAST